MRTRSPITVEWERSAVIGTLRRGKRRTVVGEVIAIPNGTGIGLCLEVRPYVSLSGFPAESRQDVEAKVADKNKRGEI